MTCFGVSFCVFFRRLLWLLGYVVLFCVVACLLCLYSTSYRVVLCWCVRGLLVRCACFFAWLLGFVRFVLFCLLLMFCSLFLSVVGCYLLIVCHQWFMLPTSCLIYSFNSLSCAIDSSPGGFLHRTGYFGIRSGRHAHAPGSSSASCCCNGSVGLNRSTCI